MNKEFLSDEKLNNLSADELKEELSNVREYWSKIYDIIQDKQLSNYDYKGKFIRVRELCGDDVYMHVRNNFISDRDGTKIQYYVCYQGHAFEYQSGEYTDSTWFSYTWWRDVFVSLTDIDRLDPSDGQPRVVEITEDEFIQKFYEGYSKLPEQLSKMMKEDKYDLEENNSENTNNGSKE